MAQEWDRRTINFSPGQFERLQELYPEHGVSAIIRLLVKAHLKKIESDDKPKLEVDINV